MEENPMQQEKMTGSMAPGGDRIANASEQPQQAWVTPQFERIPLSEAMGSATVSSTTDGAGLYS